MTDHMETIAAGVDLNGKTISVGSRVRSFDFPLATSKGLIMGMDLEGERASYMEGTIEAIGEDDIEGCLRYRILVDKIVSRGAPYPISDFFGKNPAAIYPPVNGTPTFGGKTFGVVAI